jgi:hypothetical protein
MEHILRDFISKDANAEVVNDFIALTENCEIARYAPASNAQFKTIMIRLYL